MLKELKTAFGSYVSIANKYSDLVEECASLEFIAINAGIASKQAKSDSFMKLSNEIQAMSNNVIQNAKAGKTIAYEALARITQAFSDLTCLIGRYQVMKKSSQEQAVLIKMTLQLQKEVERFDTIEIRKDANKMSRSIDNLIAQINIGKTMAVGGKIKAVYITGNEEKFKIITETMQQSITKLFLHLDQITEEFSIIRNLFSNLKREKI